MSIYVDIPSLTCPVASESFRTANNSPNRVSSLHHPKSVTSKSEVSQSSLPILRVPGMHTTVYNRDGYYKANTVVALLLVSVLGLALSPFLLVGDEHTWASCRHR